MSEILNIEELTKMAYSVIEVPGFGAGDTIKVRVKKPSLMKLLSEGSIPNHLLGVATKMLGMKDEKKLEKTAIEESKEIMQMFELYSEVCLVEPTYKEFKEIMTDQQKEYIFNWAMGDVADAETFHQEEEVQSDNNDGKALQEKA